MPLPISTAAATSLLETITAGVRPVPCPDQGWLRAVREALGLSRRAVAEELQVSSAAVRDFELAEVTDAITLRTLRRTARALGCELVIALVPADHRSFAQLAVTPKATARHHSRALERSGAPAAGGEPGELEMHLK